MRHLRFSLKSLLLAFVVCALLTVGGKKFYEWYIAVPTVPLAQAVAAFNQRSLADPVGKLEPPLTETEVVSALRAKLPALNAYPDVQQVFARIASTRQFPVDAKLESFSSYAGGFGEYTVWWINLQIVTGKHSGFGYKIRDNNHPKAKPANELGFLMKPEQFK